MRFLLFALICFAALARAVPALAILVNISISQEGDDRPLILGETNLPDGTLIIVTLTRLSDGYADQIIAHVQDGKFSAGPFALGTHPLKPGYYHLRISMPVAWMQPRNVQDVIGKGGEKLEGPFVRLSETFRVKVVEYHRDLLVGNPAPEKARRSAPRKVKSDMASGPGAALFPAISVNLTPTTTMNGSTGMPATTRASAKSHNPIRRAWIDGDSASLSRNDTQRNPGHSLVADCNQWARHSLWLFFAAR